MFNSLTRLFRRSPERPATIIKVDAQNRIVSGRDQLEWLEAMGTYETKGQREGQNGIEEITLVYWHEGWIIVTNPTDNEAIKV